MTNHEVQDNQVISTVPKMLGNEEGPKKDSYILLRRGNKIDIFYQHTEGGDWVGDR
jgi:hypothetical protein